MVTPASCRQAILHPGVELPLTGPAAVGEAQLLRVEEVEEQDSGPAVGWGGWVGGGFQQLVTVAWVKGTSA